MKTIAVLAMLVTLIGCNNAQYDAGREAGLQAGLSYYECHHYPDTAGCKPKYNDPDYIRGFIGGEKAMRNWMTQ